MADKDPPWINGALQLITLLAQKIPLQQVRDRAPIVRGSLELIPALVEAALALEEIPERPAVAGLLKYCGYNGYAARVAEH
jgi:hypothetical protein